MTCMVHVFHFRDVVMCFHPIVERPFKQSSIKSQRHDPLPKKKKSQSLCNLLTRPDALRASPALRVVL
jgi:hypothetical protein